jgi:hypothetical protein
MRRKPCPAGKTPDINRGGCRLIGKIGNRQLGSTRPLVTNPTENAARIVERAFENCQDRRGRAFWQNNRWFVEDDKRRVYAALDASPGCAGSNIDFTQVKSFGQVDRKKKR